MGERRRTHSFHLHSRRKHGHQNAPKAVAKLRVIYEPNLTQKETYPEIMVWTSMEERPKRWFQLHEMQSSSEQSTFEVSVPRLFRGNVVQRDAAVHFQAFVLVPNSDGKKEREKAGSGTVFLADVVKGQAVTVDLVLQSYLTDSENAVTKGRLTIPKGYAVVDSSLKFADSSRLDVVPGNAEHLQSSMLMQVRRNMLPFSAEALNQIKLRFRPTFEEDRQVHAPVDNNSIIPIPGEFYWADLGTDLDEQSMDDKFALRILKTSVERMGWSLDDFSKAVEQQHSFSSSSSSTVKVSVAYLRAGEASAGALCLVANSIVYIGDYAFVPDGKVTVEDFADGLMKFAGDCEDDAKLIARVFKGIRDGKFSNRHARNMQSVLRRYECMGTLGSVTSRNIAEAATQQNGGTRPRIGSQIDRSMNVGAHMWITLVPKEYYRKMLNRTTSRHLFAGDSRAAWEADLEVLICEGTGPLRPMILAEESRYSDRRRKEKAILEELKMRKALQRLLAGTGSDVGSEFEGAQLLRRQQDLKNDPEVRATTFYRVATAFFPVLPEETDRRELLEPEDDTRDIYTERYLIPVQIGSRDGSRDGSNAMTWGANLTDVVNKRSFVGALRTLKAKKKERLIIRSISRHLPPYAPIRFVEPDVSEVRRVDAWNGMLSSKGIVGSKGRSGDSTTMVVLFWRMEDLGDEQVRQIVDSMDQNREWIQGAHVEHEPVVQGLSTVRLQADVTTGDIRGIKPEMLRQILG